VGAGAGPAFSRCGSGELAGLIERLDDEFISGRGRAVSLAARFPRELSASNLDNLFVAREAGRIAGAIVVKRFRWLVPGHEYEGAMLGMVWIAPKKRGAGLGSTLLSHVGNALRDSVDFAVLWTGNPAFYARAGWKSADHGSLGRIEGNGQNAASRAAMDFARARAIWRRQLRRVERDASWQPPLPPPAESMELFEGAGAYALAGRRQETLYCYEMFGDATGFAAILDSMRASCATLYFNEDSGSPTYAWLSGQGVSWEEKPLAMWLPARERNPSALRGDWYIPWLDRI
jgi:predicted N-acetyltransferase YhbS